MILYFVILYLLLSLVSYNCGINAKTGKRSPLVASPWLYQLMWPLIFGGLYYVSRNDDIKSLVFVLIFTFFLWPMGYGCLGDAKSGVYAIIVSFYIAMLILTHTSTTYYEKIVVVAVMAWLHYALLTNILELV